MNFRHLFAATVIALSACATGDRAAPEPANIFAGPPNSTEALMQHIRTLSSDEFEGRAPGTNGERLTLAYMERMFAAAGLQPGVTNADGTRSWRQETPLISATLASPPTLTLSGRDGARSYEYATQFSAWTRRLQ